MGRHLLNEEYCLIIEKFLAGQSIEELAREFETTEDTINRALHQQSQKSKAISLSPEATIQLQTKLAREAYVNRCGANNSKTKLTMTQVQEIKKQLKANRLPYTQIAAKYNISPKTVSMIHKGQSWAWVDKLDKTRNLTPIKLQRLLTVEDAAERLGLQRDSIFALLRTGKLKGEKRGGLWFFTKKQIEEAKRKCRQRAPRRTCSIVFDSEQIIAISSKVKSWAQSKIAQKLLPELTERQRQIFKLLAEGYSRLEICVLLGMKPSTLNTHKTAIMLKLRLPNYSELIRYALDNRITNIKQREQVQHMRQKD